MHYSGPIDLAHLTDLAAIYASGECPYTFLAFPISSVNEHGVPDDSDAQRYIAAVQSAGVPVGIWLTSPVDDTAYAAVAHDSIRLLHRTIESLTSDGTFSPTFAADLSEQLFRDAPAGGG
jgi:hypothetical protein